MEYIEAALSSISESIWLVFLPILLFFSAYVGIKGIFYVKNKTTVKNAVKVKNIIGPASISLGAMIGTGAVIGVLGSINKLHNSGQMYVEAIAFWAVIGSVILVPLSYIETMTTKTVGKPPHEYIKMFINPTAGKIYAVGFLILYIFGFGGFQFSGIDSAISSIGINYFDIELSEVQRYLFIVVPIIIILAAIVLSRKHHVFIKAMTYMISVAVILYFIFFIVFLLKTTDYFPHYFEKLIMGVKSPITIGIGMPVGLIVGLQRVIQTSETGLGALGMASLEAESGPRDAAVISLLPTVVTIFVAIVVTSYIASYGQEIGTLTFGIDSTGFDRLSGFFNTGVSVTGKFGLFVLFTFTVLSGLTTLLGSFYFLQTVVDISPTKQIIAYLILMIVAGTLAIFGFSIVFDAVDMLLFLVIGINVAALTIYVTKKYKNYLLVDKQ